MEDNSNYTYTYENEEQEEAKPERSLKIVFACVIVALAVLAVVLGILFGVKSAKNEEVTTTEPTTEPSTSAAAEPVTQKAAYNTGNYSVNAEGRSLLFRTDHSKDADTILEIEDKTELTIEEIYHDETAESDDYEYWGKTTYKGHTGWVAMKYMQKEYSDSVVTPDDITTTTAETTTEAQSTSVVLTTSADSTTSATTAATTVPSTTVAQTKYSAGDYTVATGGSTINFRTGAGTGFDTIMSISDGEKLTVTVIEDTKATDESVRYWGKITYKGYSGYVCMTYLQKAN